MRDRELPNKLISMVQQMNYKTSDTDCILLLLCKLKPFVWSMQKAVNEKIVGDAKSSSDGDNDKPHVDRLNVFFKFVPSLEDFMNNGMDCEDSYHSCKLF